MVNYELELAAPDELIRDRKKWKRGWQKASFLGFPGDLWFSSFKEF